MKLKISKEKGVDIQEDLIGVFFEDINYAADGGIYAEMIENRSFEFLDARGDKDAYTQEFAGLYGWNAYPDSDGVELSIKEEKTLNDINPHYLNVKANKNSGFTNKAYDGIYIESNKKYRVSFYARVAQERVALEICALKNNDNTTGITEEMQILAQVEVASKEWQRYEVEFQVEKTMRHALFAVIFKEDAAIEFDCISMFPVESVCGVFRKDLVEKLEELRPKFIRFPGGCVVEGNDLNNRYQWKQSIGDITVRKANWNRWAVHGNNEENGYHSEFCHYNQTLGLGYYEYFLLCEYLHAKPLPVVNVGLACQYQSTELVDRTDSFYQEFIQDTLDLIEFANGDVNTKWGKMRAEMGHVEPFGLEMIGIGNEQWQTEKVDFFERYDDFEKAIHEKYPKMKLIGSAGPTVHTQTYEEAWKNYYEKCAGNDNYAYAIDEHYYMEPDWFIKNTHFYDGYDRNVKVFSGEYAAHDGQVHESTKRNNWRCALAEAAFLTGVERNADVVVLSSYAPLFARIGYVQWSPDLIWFDDTKAYGTPSFYVQKIFAQYTGTETLKSVMENGEECGVFHSVSRDKETDKCYIKLVNTSEQGQKVDLVFEADWKNDVLEREKVQLVANLYDTNSIESPDNVVPNVMSQNLNEHVILPPHSVVVIVA